MVLEKKGENMRKIAFVLCLSILSTFLQAEDLCGSWTAGADWLYWKTERQHALAGARVSNPVITENLITIKSKIEFPNFKSKSGFRVYAGYTTASEEWGITASYTYMPGSASFHGDGNPLANLSLPTALPSQILGIRGSWDSALNYVDLDLSRTVSFCDDFEIVPHVGIRGAWVHETSRVTFVAPESFSAKMKNNLRGIGLEGGLWGSWNLPYGMSLVGHVGGALVYSKSTNHGNFLVQLQPPVHFKYSAPRYHSEAWFDSMIGIVYSRAICDMLFSVHLGWEHHLIFSAQGFGILGGDLAMQGLTLGAALEF